MGNPLFAPKQAPQRFRVIHCFVDDLPRKLEEAVADGWQFCGAELAGRPGVQSYALLTKFDYPEPSPEERAAFEKSMAAGHSTQAAMERMLKMAEMLFERLGMQMPPAPQKEPGPGLN